MSNHRQGNMLQQMTGDSAKQSKNFGGSRRSRGVETCFACVLLVGGFVEADT
jgi:hypothetical protein